MASTWKYEPETKTVRTVPENYWVASMDSWDGAVNHQANAQLIAAAPDLLEALKEVIKPLMRLGDFIGNEDKGGASGLGRFDRCEIIGKVRDAIAKAEGEAEYE